MASQIHPTAIVHPEARLGDDVIVGPYAIIEEKTEIGPGCRLDAFAQVKSYVRMGAGNHVHSHAIVGGLPQDLKYKGEDTWVVLGDKNVVREFVTIHRAATGDGSETRIGSGCLLMAYVHVAHDCVLGDGVIMSNAASLAGHVLVHDRAIIGGMTGVHQFVRVGEFAYVGAMSGLALDVPPFTLASGVRAGLHGLNLVGLRRAGFGAEAVSALKKAYRLIWRGGLDRQEALEEVDRTLGALPEVRRLVDFVRSSSRGVAMDGGRNGLGEDSGEESGDA